MNPLSNFTQTGADGVSPGIFTSEFVVLLVGEFLNLTKAFGALDLTSQQQAAIFAILPTLYILGRGLIKYAAASKPTVPPTK